MTADLAFNRPIGLGPALQLAPHAGISWLLFQSYEAAGAVPALAVGTGLVVGPHAPMALRVDYTYRRFGFTQSSGTDVLHNFSLGVTFGRP